MYYIKYLNNLYVVYVADTVIAWIDNETQLLSFLTEKSLSAYKHNLNCDFLISKNEKQLYIANGDVLNNSILELINKIKEL